MNRYDMRVEIQTEEMEYWWVDVDAIKEEDGEWVRYDEIEPKLDSLERELAELTAVCETLIDVMGHAAARLSPGELTGSQQVALALYLQATLKRSES